MSTSTKLVALALLGGCGSEINNASKADVVTKLRTRHARAFEQVIRAALRRDRGVREDEVAPFASKLDRRLAGHAVLDDREAAIFERHCVGCHPPPLVTDFSYANLGLPRFEDNPFYRLPQELNPDGEAFVDRGLGNTTGDPAHDGCFECRAYATSRARRRMATTDTFVASTR